VNEKDATTAEDPPTSSLQADPPTPIRQSQRQKKGNKKYATTADNPPTSSLQTQRQKKGIKKSALADPPTLTLKKNADPPSTEIVPPPETRMLFPCDFSSITSQPSPTSPDVDNNLESKSSDLFANVLSFEGGSTQKRNRECNLKHD
jgi:hypothetical protein